MTKMLKNLILLLSGSTLLSPIVDPPEDGGGFRANDGFGRRQTKFAAVEGRKYTSPVG